MLPSECTFDGADPTSCDCEECAMAREFGSDVMDDLRRYDALDQRRDDANTMGY